MEARLEGEAAGIAPLSDRRGDSEALGLDPRLGALRREGRVLRNMLIIVYLVVGVGVAGAPHHHTQQQNLTHPNSLTSMLSAVPAVLLWPLILFGVSLHIK
jgi:hypothetical protein